MDIKDIKKAVEAAKANSPKRNFKQTVDAVINLKGLDLKKNDQQVDLYIQLHFKRRKKVKICGLVGPELMEQSKKAFDHTITADDFMQFSKKKDAKKLARQYDFFVAQGNIMAKVAQAFGSSFGPSGKMPNPKAGCVVPPNANLSALADRLQSTVRIKVKSHLGFQAPVGYEDTPTDEIADNIKTIHDQLMHHLPQEKNNIKNVVIKLTMGKPVKVGEIQEEEGKPAKKKVNK